MNGPPYSIGQSWTNLRTRGMMKGISEEDFQLRRAAFLAGVIAAVQTTLQDEVTPNSLELRDRLEGIRDELDDFFLAVTADWNWLRDNFKKEG